MCRIFIIAVLLLVGFCINSVQASNVTGIVPAITAQGFNAVCDGSTDDTAAYTASLNFYGVAVVPPSVNGCLINPGGNAGLTVGANKTVDCQDGGKIVIGASQSQGILITGSNGSVQNCDINVNGAGFGILAQGQITSPVVRHNRFHGTTTSAYIEWEGDSGGFGQTMQSPISEDNLYDQTDQSAASYDEIFESVLNFVSNRNQCLNSNAFCQQTRWSTGTINGLAVYNPNYGSTKTSSGGTLNFTVSTPVSHCSVTDNGTASALSISGCSGSGTTVSVASTTNAHAYVLYAYRALEPININSASSVTVNGGDLNGSGDRGITIGSDYHNTGTSWCLPAGVGGCGAYVFADLPFNNAVNGTVIRNTILESIGVTTGCPSNLTIGDGYLLSNFGQGETTISSAAAISLTYGGNSISNSGCNTRIGQGIIDNASATGQYGVFINGGGQLPVTAGYEQQIEIAPISFRGTFSGSQYFMGNGANLYQSIDFPGRGASSYPVQPDFTAGESTGCLATQSPYYTFTCAGTNTRVTACSGQNGQKIAQSSDLEVFPTLEVAPTTSAGGFTYGKLVRLRFWAVNNADGTGNPTVSVYSQASGPTNITTATAMAISNTACQQYEIDVPMVGTIVGLLKFQFVVGASQNTMTVSTPIIDMKPIN